MNPGYQEAGRISGQTLAFSFQVREPGPGAYDEFDQHSFVAQLERKTHGELGLGLGVRVRANPGLGLGLGFVAQLERKTHGELSPNQRNRG